MGDRRHDPAIGDGLLVVVGGDDRAAAPGVGVALTGSVCERRSSGAGGVVFPASLECQVAVSFVIERITIGTGERTNAS